MFANKKKFMSFFTGHKKAEIVDTSNNETVKEFNVGNYDGDYISMRLHCLKVEKEMNLTK